MLQSKKINGKNTNLIVKNGQQVDILDFVLIDGNNEYTYRVLLQKVIEHQNTIEELKNTINELREEYIAYKKSVNKKNKRIKALVSAKGE